jgi:hypothetical protein
MFFLVVRLSRFEEIRRAKSLTDMLPITLDFYQQARRFAESNLPTCFNREEMPINANEKFPWTVF